MLAHNWYICCIHKNALRPARKPGFRRFGFRNFSVHNRPDDSIRPGIPWNYCQSPTKCTLRSANAGTII